MSAVFDTGSATRSHRSIALRAITPQAPCRFTPYEEKSTPSEIGESGNQMGGPVPTKMGFALVLEATAQAASWIICGS